MPFLSPVFLPRFFPQCAAPAEMGEAEINAFLPHLAVRERVAASTQNQAGFGLFGKRDFNPYSSATHLLSSGYDIRAVQELLGLKDVKTTMICPHVLNRGGKGVKSPVDDL